jgi:hypothetical protein
MLFHGGVSPCSLNYDLDNRISAEVRRLFNSYTRIDHGSRAKANLDRALRTVKKAKAQEALKSYHVAFITALEGVTPGREERKLSYEQRQQALEDKLTEAWARFEVEQ